MPIVQALKRLKQNCQNFKASKASLSYKVTLCLRRKKQKARCHLVLRRIVKGESQQGFGFLVLANNPVGEGT